MTEGLNPPLIDSPRARAILIVADGVPGYEIQWPDGSGRAVRGKTMLRYSGVRDLFFTPRPAWEAGQRASIEECIIQTRLIRAPCCPVCSRQLIRGHVSSDE